MGRRKIGRAIGIAVLVALIGGVALAAPTVRKFGYLTTRASARVVCPMVYIEGRSVNQALERLALFKLFPFDPRGVVGVERDDARRMVTTSVLGLFKASATHHPGEGCVLA